MMRALLRLLRNRSHKIPPPPIRHRPARSSAKMAASSYALSTHRDEHYQFVSNHTNRPDLRTSNSPEVPPSNNRRPSVGTAKDLIVQSLRAVIVSEIKRRLAVLVLDNKLEAHAAVALWAHGLQLEGLVVAREHPAVVVAGIVDERSGLLLVGPDWPAVEAIGFDELDAKDQHAAQDGEDRGGLHVCLTGELISGCAGCIILLLRKKTNVFCGLDGERRMRMGLSLLSARSTGRLMCLLDHAGNQPPPAIYDIHVKPGSRWMRTA